MLSRRIIVHEVLVCSLLFLAGCSAATPLPTPTPVPTPTPTTARFEGTLYFLDEPFVGAMVALHDPTKDAEDPSYRVADVTTDEQGTYTFVVDPGQYTLGVTLVFENASDYPCQSISTGWIPSESTSETDPTKMTDPWFGVWGTRPDGAKILIASSDSIPVVAGDVVQKDMYATCEL